MRLATALNRMLDLPGASATDVGFGSSGVVVAVRCVAAGASARFAAECGGWRSRTTGVKRWRHLDLGAWRCTIECEAAAVALP